MKVNLFHWWGSQEFLQYILFLQSCRRGVELPAQFASAAGHQPSVRVTTNGKLGKLQERFDNKKSSVPIQSLSLLCYFKLFALLLCTSVSLSWE